MVVNDLAVVPQISVRSQTPGRLEIARASIDSMNPTLAFATLTI
jgi:hypothetical protein